MKPKLTLRGTVLVSVCPLQPVVCPAVDLAVAQSCNWTVQAAPYGVSGDIHSRGGAPSPAGEWSTVMLATVTTYRGGLSETARGKFAFDVDCW